MTVDSKRKMLKGIICFPTWTICRAHFDKKVWMAAYGGLGSCSLGRNGRNNWHLYARFCIPLEL
jgi:hypothetical protein